MILKGIYLDKHIMSKDILKVASYDENIVFLFTDTYNYLKRVCSIELLQY